MRRRRFGQDPGDVWDRNRVNRLYVLPENVPYGGQHPGEPHEWEWEGDAKMPPLCLGCNVTGDQVEEGDPTDKRDADDRRWWDVWDLPARRR